MSSHLLVLHIRYPHVSLRHNSVIVIIVIWGEGTFLLSGTIRWLQAHLVYLLSQALEELFPFHSKECWFLALENADAFHKLWMQGVTNSFHIGLKNGGGAPS